MPFARAKSYSRRPSPAGPGSSEPRIYLPVLAATQGYPGLSGDISFDEKGDLKQALLTLYTFRAGRRAQIAVVRAR
ncbi:MULTISPECIES: hypothetical protein [unclassified Variovorax]|uniref:hypothetical protein n=1 Tax=unclassified Variovorax TaxID=663243 RepID=UPI0025784936|nr:MULTISPECIES: hypothetical protein [unclassified Variovorax]MDM0086702.1 hypothetical protein [Variovorax sp. J22G40]MDM0145042.1 hypothetical protein [Variovorax sp. J2P1-31]